MRDPNIRFALDPESMKRLHDLARERNQSVSTLLRGLVWSVLYPATQKETGTHEEQDPRK